MAFWSGEKLGARLLVEKLVLPYDPELIDCASYRLRLGDQAFVTTDTVFKGKPNRPLTQVLNDTPPSNTVVIDPGQFAFLLTDETVTVPNDALAFISMRAGYKFQGLMNVSGFHVDPGFSGKLIFGVYNAGPASIILEKGLPLFLIVFADLDRASDLVYKGKANKREGIDVNLIQKMAGQAFSPMMLQRKMDELHVAQTEIAKELASIKGRGATWDALFIAIIALIVASVLSLLALDSVKSTFGGWVKSSIDLYTGNIREEVKKLPPEDKSSTLKEKM